MTADNKICPVCGKEFVHKSMDHYTMPVHRINEDDEGGMIIVHIPCILHNAVYYRGIGFSTIGIGCKHGPTLTGDKHDNLL